MQPDHLPHLARSAPSAAHTPHSTRSSRSPICSLSPSLPRSSPFSAVDLDRSPEEQPPHTATPGLPFGGRAGSEDADEDLGGPTTTLTTGDPWHKAYVPSTLGIQRPTGRDRAYTFLFLSKARDLRTLAQAKKVTQSGRKNATIAKLMIKAQTEIADGTYDWDNCFGDAQAEFWRQPVNQVECIRKAPTHHIFVTHEPAPPSSRRNSGAAAMTVEEFARLIGLLTRHESARDALIASGRDLSREQQQRREGRDAFWETLIAKLFNDSTVRVELDLRGCVSGDDDVSTVDPNAKPVMPRGGAWLKDRFFAVRALFTKAYSRWTVSGQNNPEAGGFQNFVTPAPNATTMSVQGKFTCIMFHAMGCGTVEQDTDVLNFTCKLAPRGVGFDDDEPLDARSGRTRAKRKAEELMLAESQHRSKNLEAMVATISSMANTISSGERASSGTKSHNAAPAVDQEMVLLEQLQMLTKQRAEIMALDAKDDMNARMRSALERKLKALHEKLELSAM